MTTNSGQFGDQSENPLSREELFESMSEAILANGIACDVSGLPREKLKMTVGQNGGTVIGDGMVFQTPVTVRLSEELGRLLFAAFEREERAMSGLQRVTPCPQCVQHGCGVGIGYRS